MAMTNQNYNDMMEKVARETARSNAEIAKNIAYQGKEFYLSQLSKVDLSVELTGNCGGASAETSFGLMV